MDGIAAIVAAAGGTPVLADLKTADDAAYEFALAYDAGAASATVLGLAAAPRSTPPCGSRRSAGARSWWTSWSWRPPGAPTSPRGCPGTSSSPRTSGRTPRRPGGDRSTFSGRGRRAVGWRWPAGSPWADLPALAGLPDLRVIVGSAVTKADDPLAAVQELRWAPSAARRPSHSKEHVVNATDSDRSTVLKEMRPS